MSPTQIRASENGPIMRLTLHTEGGVNVLSTQLLTRLDEWLRKVRRHSATRILVIEGEGKTFAAGADIKEMADYDVEKARAYGRLGMDTFNALASLPCVTIAALTGSALGGGLEMALACDFRVAVRTAKLGLPETTLGLIPGWGGLGRLTRLIGPSRAKMLIFSGRQIKAEEGLPMGLVDEVVNSAEDVGPKVDALAKHYFHAAPQAIALAKRALADGDDLTAFADCFLEEAAGRAGMRAFLEKRTPPWASE